MIRSASSWMLIGAAALVAAIWISICAAAPEFIWRGLRIAVGHLSVEMLLSALLLGCILAFFVEPLMERLRRLPHGAQETDHDRSVHALFRASLSLAFALASICLHDALTAFIAEGQHGGHGNTGLIAAFELTIAWAVVPFAITLAWLSAGQRLVAIPMGILAALSPALTGWLFSWSLLDIVTTTMPCLAILAFGYRRRTHRGAEGSFAYCARIVLVVAMVWFAVAILFDLALGSMDLQRYRLYAADTFWMDVRFYLGWAIGLVLAPAPPAPHPAESLVGASQSGRP